MEIPIFGPPLYQVQQSPCSTTISEQSITFCLALLSFPLDQHSFFKSDLNIQRDANCYRQAKQSVLNLSATSWCKLLNFSNSRQNCFFGWNCRSLTHLGCLRPTRDSTSIHAAIIVSRTENKSQLADLIIPLIHLRLFDASYS
jgi:hypothetical protein